MPPNSLRHLFDYNESHAAMPCDIPTFPPIIEGYDARLQSHINNRFNLDLDVACFMMLISDFPNLIKLIACPTNRNINVKDVEEFNDWLVISDPVVIKIYVGDNIEKMEVTKGRII